jgi:cytochrome c oxidase subunit III
MQSGATTLAHHFEDIDQQRSASVLGMWVFLATEVMFFGGLFLAFAVARFLYPENFNQAARHLDVVAGSINTGILFTSSFTTALAVSTLKRNWKLSTIGLLLLSIALGSLFLIIKGYEYHEKWVEGLVPGASFTSSEPAQNQLFFIFYFALTGLHGIHLLVALVVMLIVVWLIFIGRVTPERYMPLEISALYWHFVDIVWVSVFPLLYLIGGR